MDEYPWWILLTQAESLDDVTVAVDVALLQVSEQATTLTDELCQRASGHEVLVVCLHVLCQVSDAIGEQGNLCLC